MRLIDADALKRKSELVAPSVCAVPYRAVSVDEVESAHTIEAEPVRHGRWIQVDETKCRCTNCDSIVLIAIYPHGDKNYCPNCGSKNDGKEE